MKKGKMTVLLFTQWFPYNKFQEQSFLAEELLHLREHFEDVIIVPKIAHGELYDLPEGIQCDTSLSERLAQISWRTKLRLLFSLKFLREIFVYAHQPLKIRYALAKGLAAYTYRDWMIEKYAGHSNPLIFYTFWMDSQTVGALMSKSQLKNVKVASRCHNFDIYGNADNNFYVPYFHYAYPKLDAVFPDSDQGAQYLKEHVPGIHLKSGIMGVSDPGQLNEGSNDGVFRILSCAYVVERKRVDLFANALRYVQEKYPEYRIEWFHIGEGPLFEKLQEIVDQLQGGFIRVQLLGNMDHAAMMDFYRATPLDLFVNTSTHEGTPVSLMEAISFGVPLMVSDCGGNHRMADLGGGWHFPVESDEEGIAEKLKEVMDILSDGEARKLAKEKAREVWNQHYNSERNYTLFCEQLKSLLG